MKKLFSLALMVGITVTGFAQANKPVVTVENFTTSNSNYNAFLTPLRNKVISAVQEANRVNVVDINNEAALNAELERRKSELAMNDAGRVAEMGRLMSNGILKGQLDNMNVTREQTKTREGKVIVSYACKLNYTLTLVDAENGTLIKQKNFESYGTGDTDALAVESALNIRTTPVKQFILNAYAISGKVVAIDADDGKKAKKVYINLGKDDGLSKGQKLEVFKEVDIAGEMSRKLIGEIQVEEVMGASRSLCKVSKGGDIILSELQKGTNLPVQTKEQKSNFFQQIVED